MDQVSSKPFMPKFRAYEGTLCKTCGKPITIMIKYDYTPFMDEFGKMGWKAQYSYKSDLCYHQLHISYRNGLNVYRDPKTYDERLKIQRQFAERHRLMLSGKIITWRNEKDKKHSGMLEYELHPDQK